MNPWRVDGHLHDLALEDLLCDEASPEARDHLEQCAACRARLQAARDVSPLGLSIGASPPARPGNRAWIGVAALVAVAASALLVRRPADDDGISVRGSEVGLRVYLDEGGGSRRLRTGDAIAPGDRLGFSVEHPEGYLMVVGVDAEGAPYLCYPQRGGGSAEWAPASTEPRALPEAIRMDERPGEERLVLVVCDAPFGLDEALEERGDCVRSEVTVVKP